MKWFNFFLLQESPSETPGRVFKGNTYTRRSPLKSETKIDNKDHISNQDTSTSEQPSASNSVQNESTFGFIENKESWSNNGQSNVSTTNFTTESSSELISTQNNVNYQMMFTDSADVTPNAPHSDPLEMTSQCVSDIPSNITMVTKDIDTAAKAMLEETLSDGGGEFNDIEYNTTSQVAAEENVLYRGGNSAESDSNLATVAKKQFKVTMTTTQQSGVGENVTSQKSSGIHCNVEWFNICIR